MTFARVIARIDAKLFEYCARQWFQQIYQLSMWDIINFDGKTACASGHVNGNKKNMHLVNAYSPKHEVTLGSQRVPEKTNEIKAIPVLLNELNITGTIITSDAMGTQRGIAKLIREKQAHYVLGIKENQKRLCRFANFIFEKSDQLNYQNMVCEDKITNDYGHQRIEDREYTILPAMYFFNHKKKY